MKLNPSILKTSLLIAMTAILASCSETQTTTTPTAAKPESTTVKTVDPSKKLKLAFVTNNTSDFWKIAEAGTKKAVAEIPNIEVLFKRNPDNTAAEQTRLVDDLLSIGIDGLAISPVDPKNQTQLLNKAAAQGLVVTQDSDAEGSSSKKQSHKVEKSCSSWERLMPLMHVKENKELKKKSRVQISLL
jgi:ribose transport system substrate-binding protein